ncbi:hypothetical protein SAMN02745216_04211 [Desulfatibacillum alkenivorans DSM 16219]|uniref:Uncharacterized protein n=1 Tax=Desulfatibacillum alkenivorans DSM 16219 TaxID=1121393 RepID=A0A1M6VYH7_9BACT|nr:hypothetical protein [Desulfatibacillum alkenivorans]SHK86386.1 hypothetical protein SAMN02745216_04211 [Desulfatibacillum alkenivorans DSM 16219]
MTTKEEELIAAEADARLDEFFSEDEWEAEVEDEALDPAEELGIKELKALILSLDWEITDEIMAKLKGEVDRLKSRWEDDPVVKTFLSLLDNLGKYIAKRKAEAHPDSVGLLQNAYKNLEKVLSMTGMDQESRKQIVMEDVAKFKKLREEIAASKAPKETGAPPSDFDFAEEAPPQAEADEGEGSTAESMVSVESPGREVAGGAAVPGMGTASISMDTGALEVVMEKVVIAIAELTETIRTESEALRKEIQDLKNRD